ncbi:PHM/PNGase F domain-containing protein [Chytriomyces cf. hyalinus JEL632]|nr:PHM/PNGase F domain-containing protein [Chytriomyces cf. hyalinus JEL632]
MRPPHSQAHLLLSIHLALYTHVQAATCYANLPKSQFPNCVLIDPSYALHWSTNGSAIIFGVDVDVPSNNKGWVGLGISEHGGMFGADLWTVQANADGKWSMKDSFSHGPGAPVADSSQDLFLLTEPKPSSTNTVFTFGRAINTCEEGNDMQIKQGVKHHVIWAFGEGQSSYHGEANRGNTAVVLYPTSQKSMATIKNMQAKQAISDLAASDQLQVFDAQFPTNIIPAEDTSYICSHFEVPRDKKYQIVQYEAIVTSKHVHHMIFYGCTSKPAQLGDKFECSNMESLCSQAALLWAPGNGMTVFPAEAGLPIGPGGFEYFALQIHYDNPESLSDVVDHSGFRIYYTSALRQFEIGLLLIGRFDLDIPGNSPNYTPSGPGICPSSCTSRFPGNLTVVSNALHMHTLGYNITTRQFRGDQEIISLGDRHYYDFNFQGTSPPNDENAVIMPGDTLVTECTFKPTAGVRTAKTTFGENTSNEMCLNYIAYYPRMTNIAQCFGIKAENKYALCSTGERLESANKTASQLFASGDIVTIAQPKFKPYIAPVCQNSLLQPAPLVPGVSASVSGAPAYVATGAAAVDPTVAPSTKSSAMNFRDSALLTVLVLSSISL